MSQKAKQKIHPELPADLHRRLMAFARAKSISQSEAVAQLLAWALDREPHYYSRLAAQYAVMMPGLFIKLAATLVQGLDASGEDEALIQARARDTVNRWLVEELELAFALTGKPIKPLPEFRNAVMGLGLPQAFLEVHGLKPDDTV